MKQESPYLFMKQPRDTVIISMSYSENVLQRFAL